MLAYLSLVGFVFSVIGFCLVQNHTLNLLISLEAMMLSLLVLLYSMNNFFCSSTYTFLVLLTFAACEAALGLSLLVSLLRLYGNDLIGSFSSMNFFA